LLRRHDHATHPPRRGDRNKLNEHEKRIKHEGKQNNETPTLSPHRGNFEGSQINSAMRQRNSSTTNAFIAMQFRKKIQIRIEDESRLATTMTMQRIRN